MALYMYMHEECTHASFDVSMAWDWGYAVLHSHLLFPSLQPLCGDPITHVFF
jgi:hypothetical protein